jgi:hypothetical protein
MMDNYILGFGVFLFVLLIVLHTIKRTVKKEGYAYEYPYSFFQCARRRCPFENRRAEYLTDQDAFVEVY